MTDPLKTRPMMNVAYTAILCVVSSLVIYGAALFFIQLLIREFDINSLYATGVVVGVASAGVGLVILCSIRYERNVWGTSWGAILIQEILIISYILAALYWISDTFLRKIP